MFHLYFLLSLSVESAKFCKSCTVPALFKVHQKVLNALSKVLGLTWVQWQFCCYEIKCNSVKSFRCGSKGRSQFKLSARLHASLHFRKSLFKSVVWILLLHVECVYICVYKFLYVMSCDFRMPGCFTRCGDTLWEKSEQPWRPEARTERRPCSIRSLDFFGADVFQEMWDRKRLENRKEIETDARFVMLCCFLYGHGANC